MFMVRKGCCKVVVLSVIVPVYNMAKDGNLEYCMNSLVNQTLEGMEIIAVDDASTDNSLEILRNFEKKYPERVKVIASPENKRQGGARNLGLKEANGQYIGFMDADDWAALDLFEKWLSSQKALVRMPLELICAEYMSIRWFLQSVKYVMKCLRQVY